jgi:protein-disulfide isomerase-like protein with CxxC motif
MCSWCYGFASELAAALRELLISRAFVTGRELVPGLDPLGLFRALQRLFYVDGLDTTDD